MMFFPFGNCRNSQPEIENFPTDRLFTGQKYDDTGLYYYGARYYDADIGRFISADTMVSDPMNPHRGDTVSALISERGLQRVPEAKPH